MASLFRSDWRTDKTSPHLISFSNRTIELTFNMDGDSLLLRQHLSLPPPPLTIKTAVEDDDDELDVLGADDDQSVEIKEETKEIRSSAVDLRQHRRKRPATVKTAEITTSSAIEVKAEPELEQDKTTVPNLHRPFKMPKPDTTTSGKRGRIDIQTVKNHRTLSGNKFRRSDSSLSSFSSTHGRLSLDIVRIFRQIEFWPLLKSNLVQNGVRKEKKSGGSIK